MIAFRPFSPARSLGRVLDRLGRLAGALVPLGAPKGGLASLLADPLARFSAPPLGEATLALALAGLESRPAGAARGSRRTRPAPAVGSPPRPAASPLAQLVRATAGMYAAPSPASALLGSFAPPPLPRARGRSRSGVGSALAPALEAFTRRVAGGKSAAASPLAPDGVTDVLADALAAAAAVAVGLGEAAAVATSTALDDRAASSGAPLSLAALGRLAAGAAVPPAEPSRPPAATTLGVGVAELLAAAFGGAGAAAPPAAGGRTDPAASRPAGGAPTGEELGELAAGAFGGQLGLLVQRWQADRGEVAVRTARQPAAPSLTAHLDTEAFARTLERVLTAEARRHGITVESG